MDIASFHPGVSPQRRREMATAMRQEMEKYLDINEPPTRRFEFMNGTPVLFHNATAVALLCEWMMQASDHELSLLSSENVNAVIDAVVFDEGQLIS
jgi:hypothetical protein